jgi:hypothetical protein
LGGGSRRREFKANLGYIENPISKHNKQKIKKQD